MAGSGVDFKSNHTTTFTIPTLLEKVEEMLSLIERETGDKSNQILERYSDRKIKKEDQKDIFTAIKKKLLEDEGFLFIRNLKSIIDIKFVKDRPSSVEYAQAQKNGFNPRRLYGDSPNPFVRIDLKKQQNPYIHEGSGAYPQDSQFTKLTNAAIVLSKLRDWLIYFAKVVEDKTDDIINGIFEFEIRKDQTLPTRFQGFISRIVRFSCEFLNKFSFVTPALPILRKDSEESILLDDEALEKLEKWGLQCLSGFKEVNKQIKNELQKHASQLENLKKRILEQKQVDPKLKTKPNVKATLASITRSPSKLVEKKEISVPPVPSPSFWQRNRKEIAIGALATIALIAVNVIPIVGQIASIFGWIAFGCVLAGGGLAGGGVTAGICALVDDEVSPLAKKTVKQDTQKAKTEDRAPSKGNTQIFKKLKIDRRTISTHSQPDRESYQRDNHDQEKTSSHSMMHASRSMPDLLVTVPLDDSATEEKTHRY